MITMAIFLCIYAGLSARKAVKSMEVMNHMLHGVFGDIPAHTTIRTWLAKLGLDVIKHKRMSLDKAYAIIMDASISVNGQQMLLALKIPADHTGKALTHADEEVVGMAVASSWPSEKVKEFCEEITEEQGKIPSYYLTDNGSNLSNAVSAIGVPHHRDISHSFALYLKKIYENDDEFISFKKLVGNTKHLALSELTYLMPPKQRSTARFMNMYPVIEWAKSMLDNFIKLNSYERYYFSFIQRYAGFIEEMNDALGTFTAIMEICKKDGLSIENITKCKGIMKRTMLLGSERERKVYQLVNDYLDREGILLSTEYVIHHISSDLIESDFGIFKESMPSNKTTGFTESILYIPLRPKLHSVESIDNLDIAIILKRTKINDVTRWKETNLKPNPLVKRLNILDTA